MLLEVDPDRIYRRLRKGVIDPSYVNFDEAADIYPIQDYPGLIEALRQSLVNVSGTHA